MRSPAATPLNVIVALAPLPANLNWTSPGGTPFSSKFPLPSTVVVMSVPTIVTVTVVVAIGRAPVTLAVAETGTPVTRPVIVAVPARRKPDGPAGERASVPPQAAAAVDSPTTKTADSLEMGTQTSLRTP